VFLAASFGANAVEALGEATFGRELRFELPQLLSSRKLVWWIRQIAVLAATSGGEASR